MFETDQEFEILLSSGGLAGLWVEKQRLEHRREQLTYQTRELAFQHYPTFIAAADCCKAIAKDFAANQDQLARTIDRVPKLAEACARFRENVQKVSVHRKRTSMVLAKHTRLLEVLELPQLMDTCVKNGQHEEALAIQQLCGKLQKPMGSIPLVRSILDAVHLSSLWMLNQLLSRLKSQIQLPECLRVIGYIRRMGAFNETQLRLKFLQAREAYFGSSVQQASAAAAAASSADSYAYLCRVIELTRICIFDTITQYRALFSDEESLYGTSQTSAATGGGATSVVVYRQIFPSWLFWKLNGFLECFRGRLTKDLDEQALDSLIGQAMYFGQSLGRVGFDFRVLLVPIFLQAVMERATSALHEGIRCVEEILQEQQGQGGREEQRYDETDISLLDSEGAAMLKLNFYSLAEMCNAVIQACNKLRYTAPVVARPLLARDMQAFVERCGQLLADARKRLAVKGTEKERQVLAEVEEQFGQRVAPFCNRCLVIVFGEDEEGASLAKFGVRKDVELASAMVEDLAVEKIKLDSDGMETAAVVS